MASCGSLLALAGLVWACSPDSPSDPDADALRALAAFVASPAEGATGVPVGAWPEIRFSSARSLAALSNPSFACDAAAWPAAFHRLPPNRLVVRPDHRLPRGARCVVGWRSGGAEQAVSFEVWTGERLGARDRGLQVFYPRHDSSEIAPVPDDYWTRVDATTKTGRRLDLPVTLSGDLRAMVTGLSGELDRLDGWSPIAPIVLMLSNEVDPATLPRSVAESLDPTATVALVDIDPKSPARGSRFPFELVLRVDRTAVGIESSALWLIPARPLRPGGRYAVLFRRAITTPTGRGMLRPSVFHEAFGGAGPRSDGVAATLGGLLAPAIEVARNELSVPWSDDDLVFALTFTVRSLDTLADDPLALRRAVGAMPGPRLRIESVEPGPSSARPFAALVRGQFVSPSWRHPGQAALARDSAGKPQAVGRRAIPFTLALPRAALEGPVPLILYQHGHPGRAEEEIGSALQDPFLEAGFAVAGFTDLWNRDVPVSGIDRRAVLIGQVLALTVSIRADGVVPDDWLVTLGEQLAFVAALEELSRLDVLPIGAPDGRGEIDRDAPLLYEGVSQGAIHGQSLLAYAPEISAASLVAGGPRLAELMLHQAADDMLDALPFVFGDFRPIDLWTTLALFQTAVDRQDPHLHAWQLQRGQQAPPVGGGLVAGHAGRRRGPSVLLTAGRGDRFVPNRASRSLAWVLGPLAWVSETGEPVEPGWSLPVARLPLRGNLRDGATGAYVEYVPAGSDRPATPGCEPSALPLPAELLREGHFCAQLASESLRRRVTFLRSAISEVAPVVERDPAEDPGRARKTKSE